ncbi:MAG: hypothetical protein AAFS10_27680, partial [Myxococcota bacterium]
SPPSSTATNTASTSAEGKAVTTGSVAHSTTASPGPSSASTGGGATPSLIPPNKRRGKAPERLSDPSKAVTVPLGFFVDTKLPALVSDEVLGRLFRDQGRCFSVPNQSDILCWTCRGSATGTTEAALLLGSADSLALMPVYGAQCPAGGAIETVVLPFEDIRLKPNVRKVVGDKLVCGPTTVELIPLQPDRLKQVRAHAQIRAGAPRKLQKLFRRENGDVIMVQTVAMAPRSYLVEVAMGQPPRLTFTKASGGGMDGADNLEVILETGERLYFPNNTLTFSPLNDPESTDQDLPPSDEVTITPMSDGTPIAHPAHTQVKLPPSGWAASTYQPTKDGKRELLKYMAEEDYNAQVTWPKLATTRQSPCLWFGIDIAPDDAKPSP